MRDDLLQQPVTGSADIHALSDRDRALLRRWLAVTERPQMTPLSRRRRGAAIATMAAAAILLLPWIAILSSTLPDRVALHQWRLAWIGFDIALAITFAATAWAGWRRRQMAVVLLIVLGVLLLADAWFDIALSWDTSEHIPSLLTAGLIELPIAALALLLARRVLVGTMEHLWRLDGRPDPVPSLRRLPMVFLASRAEEADLPSGRFSRS